MCPPLWFGRQSVLFRQTGSGKCEVPSILHFSTAHASLCGRFSYFRPTRFHHNGNPPDHRHPRVTGLEDKHEQVCFDSFSSSNLRHIIQSTPEGISIRKVQEKLRRLKKVVQRFLQRCMASAQVIAQIAGQCIAMAKLVMPGKLCPRSLYRLLHRNKNVKNTVLT